MWLNLGTKEQPQCVKVNAHLSREQIGALEVLLAEGVQTYLCLDI